MIVNGGAMLVFGRWVFRSVVGGDRVPRLAAYGGQRRVLGGLRRRVWGLVVLVSIKARVEDFAGFLGDNEYMATSKAVGGRFGIRYPTLI